MVTQEICLIFDLVHFDVMRDELAIWLTDSTFLILFIHKKYLLVRLLTNHKINGYEQSKHA